MTVVACPVPSVAVVAVTVESVGAVARSCVAAHAVAAEPAINVGCVGRAAVCSEEDIFAGCCGTGRACFDAGCGGCCTAVPEPEARASSVCEGGSASPVLRCRGRAPGQGHADGAPVCRGVERAEQTTCPAVRRYILMLSLVGVTVAALLVPCSAWDCWTWSAVDSLLGASANRRWPAETFRASNRNRDPVSCGFVGACHVREQNSGTLATCSRGLLVVVVCSLPCAGHCAGHVCAC